MGAVLWACESGGSAEAVWEDELLDRLGFGEGGREFGELEQQLRVCLRDALSMGAAADVGGSCGM